MLKSRQLVGGSARLGCLRRVSNLQFLTDGAAVNSNLWETAVPRLRKDRFPLALRRERAHASGANPSGPEETESPSRASPSAVSTRPKGPILILTPMRPWLHRPEHSAASFRPW